MNRQNANHAARSEKFVYSLVKITRMYDCQTWPTRGAQRHVGFFLDCALRMLIGWADKLRSRGRYIVADYAVKTLDQWNFNSVIICPCYSHPCSCMVLFLLFVQLITRLTKYIN